MAEISYCDAALSDAIVKLNDFMGKVATAPPDVRFEMLLMADVKLKTMVELTEKFQLALRHIPGDQRTVYRKKFEEHWAHVEALSSAFRWAEAQQERSGLFGDRIAISPAGIRGPHGFENMEVLEKTVEIQSETEQRLMSMAKMVEQSKDAAAVAEALRSQREHIVEVTDAVTGIGSSLQRVEKLLHSFVRRMTTDRILLLLTFLVLVGIAGTVAYKRAASEPQQ